jgi:hypothetical protein
MVFMLLQAGKLPVLLGIPHPAKILAVRLGLLPNKVLRTARKITLDHPQRVDLEYAVVLTVDGMKMRHAVFTKVHLDQDSVEPGNHRHGEPP